MKPEDYGIRVPQDLDEQMFRDGFAHGMRSNALTNFKKSFREGFRAAKLLCKELRKQQGVFTFPMQARIKFKVKTEDEPTDNFGKPRN